MENIILSLTSDDGLKTLERIVQANQIETDLNELFNNRFKNNQGKNFDFNLVRKDSASRCALYQIDIMGSLPISYKIEINQQEVSLDFEPKKIQLDLFFDGHKGFDEFKDLINQRISVQEINEDLDRFLASYALTNDFIYHSPFSHQLENQLSLPGFQEPLLTDPNKEEDQKSLLLEINFLKKENDSGYTYFKTVIKYMESILGEDDVIFQIDHSLNMFFEWYDEISLPVEEESGVIYPVEEGDNIHYLLKINPLKKSVLEVEPKISEIGRILLHSTPSEIQDFSVKLKEKYLRIDKKLKEQSLSHGFNYISPFSSYTSDSS